MIETMSERDDCLAWVSSAACRLCAYAPFAPALPAMIVGLCLSSVCDELYHYLIHLHKIRWQFGPANPKVKCMLLADRIAAPLKPD